MNDFSNIDSLETLRVAIQRRILACMETGQVDQARTLVNEFAEHNPTLADQLRSDIAASYGTFL